MSDSPFKMLDSYEERDYDHFFGREKETAQLYNAVFASNLTLLYGASGTGKTSLVDCGLRNSFYDTDWFPVFIRRSGNINQALQDTLYLRIKACLQKWPEKIKDSFSIKKAIQVLYQCQYRPIYLIFDQFEELFISGNRNEQKQFYHTIKDLLESGLQAKVLLVFREEWIAHLNEFERVIPTLFENRLRIERMSEGQLLEVIEGTINYANIDWEHNEDLDENARDVVKLILENLRRTSKIIELANLQIYLDRLYRNDKKRIKKEGQQRAIRFDHELINETHNIEDVLAEFLEEQIAALEDELQKKGMVTQKGIPMDILYGLVTDDGTKRSLTKKTLENELSSTEDEAKQGGISTAVLDYCIKRFNKMRIIRILSED